MRTGAVIEPPAPPRHPDAVEARIEDWQEGRAFVDRQIRGPYRLSHHRHEFEPHPDGTLVRDHVRYALPLVRWRGRASPAGRATWIASSSSGTAAVFRQLIAG